MPAGDSERRADDERVHVPHLLAVAAAYSWRLLVVLAAVAALVYVLVVLRLIVIPIFIALLISTLLVPLADLLRARRVPNLLATWLVFASAIVLFLGFFVAVAPQVADQLDDLGQDVRSGAEDVVTWLVEGPLDLSRAEVNRYIDQVAEEFRDRQSSLISGAFRGAYVLIEIVAGFLLTMVLTFFFLKDGDRFSKGILGLFPSARRDDLRALGRRSWAALTGYMRGTAVVGVVDAAAIGITLLILGVPLVVPLAVITFFGAFFPLIGAVLAGTIATLVALVTTGFIPALIVLGVTIVVQQVEGDVIQPLVLGRAVNLHPLVILLSITAGAVVAGIAGAFLAVPVAAVTSTCVAYLRGRGDGRRTREGEEAVA